MRALFVQISGFAGVFSFLSYMWNNASIERTVFVSLAVGLLVYLVLTTGDIIIRQILMTTKSQEPEDAKVKGETETKDPTSTPTAETARA